MKLERHNIITPAREIKRIVLSSLTSRFPNDNCLYAMRGDFELKDLKNGLARVEKFQSEKKKERPVPRVSRCPCGRRPNREWGRSSWTRPARQAHRRAPRRWSWPQSVARASEADEPRAACTPGSSTSHPRRCYNSHTHGCSSSSSSSRRDFLSHNSTQGPQH